MILFFSARLKGIFLLLIPFIIPGVLVMLSQRLWASPPGINKGLKTITNYSRKDYNSQAQNWSVIQDNRGIIYLGNQGGVLEFDGVSWREILIPNQTARSLAIAGNGTLYVGGMNEIGYLAPNSIGALTFVSLTPSLPEKYKNFSEVWRTHNTKDGIYFGTSKFLFLNNSQKIQTWEAAGSFSPPFVYQNTLFTRTQGIGLLEMKNHSLQLIPNGESFAAQKVYMIAEHEPGMLLIGTGSNGFFLYNIGTGKVTPFETNALPNINVNGLSYGILLSSGDFALATLQGGIFIIDHQGNLKKVFNSSSGLMNNRVNYLYEDFQGNIWAALNNGAAKIEYTSPFSFYNERNRLPGIILSITSHGPDKTLYAGTIGGLYRLDSSGEFAPVPGITAECWSMLSVDDTLLIATNTGVFQVENTINRALTSEHSYFLYHSRFDPDRIWVGKAHGLDSLYKSPGTHQWQLERQFNEITCETRTITEDTNGSLWLGTQTKGVFRIRFRVSGKALEINSPEVKQFGTSEGLPQGDVNVCFPAGHPLFTTSNGIFYFDEGKQEFLPDYTFGESFAGNRCKQDISRIIEDTQGHSWFQCANRIIEAIPRPNASYIINQKSFLSLPLAQVNDVYIEPDGKTTWFASVDGLIRYDVNKKKNVDLPFQSLIREIAIAGKTGNTIFAGHKLISVSNPPIREIQYEDRNLRFRFAATFFEAESATRYQYKLDGYDPGWSEFTGEPKKDYTNLDPGMYTFRVRARNVYGTIGKEDAFQFRILPPWFRTWWAYLLYILTAVFIVLLIVRWRSLHLLREKQYLQFIIKESTKEIQEKNRQLEEQAIRLKEMDNVKSRFFANISHEFRTPLTLILGPLDQMLHSPQENEAEQKKKMRLMQRNSQRLLSLINQLLMLSKFDSGVIRLQAVQQNIIPFLRGILFSFDSLALKHEIELSFQSSLEEIPVYFDTERMEEVISNLISNAVKFTPPGGRVELRVDHGQIEPSETQPRFVEIAVSDTGPGIAPNEIETIFDRFYQADSTYEHHRQGTGIGLSIAREIVELHHGTIHVVNRETISGALFIIRIPLGKDHLKPHDIVDGVVKSVKTIPVIEKPFPQAAPEEFEDIETVDRDEDVFKETTEEKDIILVIEDSADVREYIHGALESIYFIHEAIDGNSGLQKAREIVPDLVICDVMMPGKDGFEVCRELKSDRITSHIPVILLTAKAGEESILTGFETGADDYITKPFNTRILCARIRNLIELRKQMQLIVNREMLLQPTPISVSSVDKEFLKELKQVIEANLSDTQFNVDQLARKLYMSHATVYRKVHALTGETPTDFIRSYRLKRGAELLKQGKASVLEIALDVGFSSATYFTKCFKKKFNMLPSEYRNSPVS